MDFQAAPPDASARALRERTDALVLEALRRHLMQATTEFRDRTARPIPRGVLADAAGLSRPSVNNALKRLPSWLVEQPARGAVALRADAAYAVAVEFATRRARVAVSDLAGRLHPERAPYERPFPPGAPPQLMLDWVAEAVGRLLVEAKVPADRVIGIGISRAAPVHRTTGLAHPSGLANLEWRDVNVREELEARLGWLGKRAAAARRSSTDNDANLSALAEQTFGAAVGLRDFAYVKWSDSVAVGLVLAGAPYRGSEGYAGQVGHLLIDWRSPGQRRCRVCDKEGCLETKVGAVSLAEELALPEADSPRIADALLALAERSPAAARKLEYAARLMGEAVASTVDTVNPECVIVGGWLGSSLHSDARLLASFREELERHVMGFGRGVGIRRPRLHRSAVHGAALQVLDEHFVPWARDQVGGREMDRRTAVSSA